MSDEVKKLYRSTDDVMLAGVCSGLAKYFNVDVTLVRVIFVVLALAGLGGVILYLVLWVLVPPEPAAGGMAASAGEESAGEGSAGEGSAGEE